MHDEKGDYISYYQCYEKGIYVLNIHTMSNM